MAIDAVNVRTLKNNPSEALEKATHGPVIVLKGDKPAAVLLSFEGIDASEDIRASLAKALFEAEVVTLGKAARISGMTYGEFVSFLGRHGVPIIRYGEDDLQRELETVRGW